MMTTQGHESEAWREMLCAIAGVLTVLQFSIHCVCQASFCARKRFCDIMFIAKN